MNTNQKDPFVTEDSDDGFDGKGDGRSSITGVQVNPLHEYVLELNAERVISFPKFVLSFDALIFKKKKSSLRSCTMVDKSKYKVFIFNENGSKVSVLVTTKSLELFVIFKNKLRTIQNESCSSFQF